MRMSGASSLIFTLMLLLLGVGKAFITTVPAPLQSFTLDSNAATLPHAMPPLVDVGNDDNGNELAIMAALNQRRTERQIKSAGLAIGATFVALSALGELYLVLHSTSDSVPILPLALFMTTLVGAITIVLQEKEGRFPLSSDLQNAMVNGGRDEGLLGVQEGRGLIVQNAKGRGMGLFATEDIASGEFLLKYQGEQINEEELLRRYGPEFVGDYVFELGPDLFEDATDPTKSNLARYMNHEFSNSTKCNVNRIRQKWPMVPQVLFFAARDIVEGEELCFDYGADYWTGRENLLVVERND